MNLVRVIFIGQMPQDLAQAFLQHVRDFDAEHPGCQFEIAADAPDMTMAEMMEAVKIDPPLPYIEGIPAMSWNSEADALRQEIDRLRAQYEWAVARAADLMAENERLRASTADQHEYIARLERLLNDAANERDRLRAAKTII